MSRIKTIYINIINKLENISNSVPQLFLRLLLAWEFGEAGYQKLVGQNWFHELAFPFPFNLLPPEVSWNLSIFFEIIGAIALIIGLCTRFFSLSLIILTIVAIAAVHWPEHWGTIGELFKGYRIIDEEGDGFGNYKLPLIYIGMLLPLLFGGAGKISLDYLIKMRFINK